MPSGLSGLGGRGGSRLGDTIPDDGVTNAKLAEMAQATVKGRASGAGTGNPTDLTAAQLLAILQAVDGAGSGLDADTVDGVEASALGGRKYSTVDTTVEPATGEIIADGLFPDVLVFTVGGGSATKVPALGGLDVGSQSRAIGALWAMANATGPMPIALVRGTKISIKGHYRCAADAPITDTHERFALGLVFSDAAATTLYAQIASETETVRDDLASTLVVVDDAENIKSYNCDTAGDATYTDSTFDADLSAGTAWEMIIEVPSMAAAAADIDLTVKVEDSGGTMRTILNAAAPAAAFTSLYAHLIVLVNQDGLVSNMVAKVEKAA